MKLRFATIVKIKIPNLYKHDFQHIQIKPKSYNNLYFHKQIAFKMLIILSESDYGSQIPPSLSLIWIMPG